MNIWKQNTILLNEFCNSRAYRKSNFNILGPKDDGRKVMRAQRWRSYTLDTDIVATYFWVVASIATRSPGQVYGSSSFELS